MLNEILKNWRKSCRGPTPKIDLEDLAIALIMISRGGVIGRYRLSDAIGIPQGTVRGIMKRFSENKLIKIDARGCEITSEGEKALKEYFDDVGIEFFNVYGENEFKFLAPGKVKALVIVRDKLDKVTNGLKQRDEAVRAGAQGATTIILRNGEIIIPSMDKHIEEYCRNEKEALKNIVGIYGSHVAIICWAESEVKAIKGVLKAVKTLVT
ncbi:MAG: DUF4443 domain-containing protein [Candidatus Methanomethylicia archaeon]